MQNVTSEAVEVQAGTSIPGLAISATITHHQPPAEMQARRQWVAFKLEPRPNQPKPAKIPYRTHDQRAKTTDPTHWLSYDDAVALAAEPGFAGVGFVFAPDDGLAGIDLDHARDPATGNIAPWAKAIVDRFASYTEVSPSGTGLHIIVRGTIASAVKTQRVEVYDRERYFTITGQVVPGYEQVAPAPDVDAFAAEYRSVPRAEVTTAVPPRLTALTDAEVVALIQASRDATAFHRLYIAGDTRPNRSESESDFELACLLARHVGGDTDRITRIMRDSPLADRKKWDQHKTYLPMTIANALRKVGTRDVATGPQKRSWLTLDELLALPPMQWIIEGLIQAEGVGVLVGNRGAYKSILLLDWLAAIASGAPDWFGIPIKKHGPAVYVYAEGRAGIGQRVQAVKLARYLDPSVPLIVFPTVVNIAEPRAVEQFIRDIETALGGKAPAIVGIDTLARNMPGKNENLQVDMGAAIGGCDTLREHFGCFVQLVHHENRQGNIRGSTVLDGAVDTQLNVERTAKLETRLTDPKQKDAEDEHAWIVRFRKEAASIVVASVEATTAPATASAALDPLFDPKRGSGKVFRAIAKAHPEPIKYGAWLKASEVGKGTFTTAKNTFVDKEFVWYEEAEERYGLRTTGIEKANELGWLDAKKPY
jgi:hypothetical protein